MTRSRPNEPKPIYRFWPALGMVRVNKRTPKQPQADWCPSVRGPYHAYQPAPFDARFEVCTLCGFQRRRPGDT